MEQGFLDAMNIAGIPSTHSLILDGKLRRYRVNGDKKGRRNGWYRYVRLRDDFAWGVFGCNKRGITVKWQNKEKNEVTAYDRKLIKAKQAEIEKSEEELQARAADKANDLWGRSRVLEGHPYATRKGVRLYGVRELNNSLVIPLSVNNYIVSLQFVNADGGKRYLTGGQKKGACFVIGDDTDVLYLVEGYATGASIHEAMGKQVWVAFDSGNLVDVAAIMRGRWPDKKIIVCADNDQFTKGNPGLSKAQEAADKIGAKVIFPKFPGDDPAKATDWNDWHARHGLKSLAEELLGMKKTDAPAVREESQWKMQLMDGKEERPGYRAFESKSKENAYLFLQNHELFAGMLMYNEFSDNIFMVRCPPWENAEKFAPRELKDTDASMIVRMLERIGIRTSKEIIGDYIAEIAYKNPVNPAREYFESLRWDGKPRLTEWLIYYLGAEKQGRGYLEAIGPKWIMGAVSRIYQPGCKFDNVLILEGMQDIRKSTAFETLASINGEAYFLEFFGDINSKDSIAEMQGNIIVEMAELSTLNRAEVNHMKAFITHKVDKYRPPYARRHIKRPRQFIFGATTNNDGTDGYLLDPTGGRRYWPVQCGEIDIETLAEDREQLWAEAVYRWKTGEKTWLQEDEKLWAGIEQDKRQHEDSWMQPIEKFLNFAGDDGLGRRVETSVFEIAKELNLTADQTNPKNEKRIVKCLKEMAWEPVRPIGGVQPLRKRTDDGKRITIWRRKDGE